MCFQKLLSNYVMRTQLVISNTSPLQITFISELFYHAGYSALFYVLLVLCIISERDGISHPNTMVKH